MPLSPSLPLLVTVQQCTDYKSENKRLPLQSHNPPLLRPLPCQFVLLFHTASHSPATILGVKTGTKWQLSGEQPALHLPPTSCWSRLFPRHWSPQDSVNYCQCVNCRDRPKRHAGRDEIGGKRAARGFCVSTRWHF